MSVHSSECKCLLAVFSSSSCKSFSALKLKWSGRPVRIAQITSVRSMMLSSFRVETQSIEEIATISCSVIIYSYEQDGRYWNQNGKASSWVDWYRQSNFSRKGCTPSAFAHVKIQDLAVDRQKLNEAKYTKLIEIQQKGGRTRWWYHNAALADWLRTCVNNAFKEFVYGHISGGSSNWERDLG